MILSFIPPYGGRTAPPPHVVTALAPLTLAYAGGARAPALGSPVSRITVRVTTDRTAPHGYALSVEVEGFAAISIVSVSVAVDEDGLAFATGNAVAALLDLLARSPV